MKPNKNFQAGGNINIIQKSPTLPFLPVNPFKSQKLLLIGSFNVIKQSVKALFKSIYTGITTDF